MAELLTDRNMRIATMQDAQAKAMLDKAFDEGYLTPAMRGWATALCQQDPASFKAFINTAPRPFAHLLSPLPRPLYAVASQNDDSDEAAAICAQLGLKPGTLNS
jgi:phage I-like protein